MNHKIPYLAWFVCFVTPIAGAGSEIDIFLQVRDGRITTGQIDASTGEPIAESMRVFAGTFGESGVPEFTNDPGFFAFSGTFPLGSTLGFNILDGLKVWTGDGFEAAATESISIEFAGGALQAASASGFVPGFSLAVSPVGGYHRHLSFFLHGPNAGGRLDPAPGIFLLELEKTSSSPAIAPSAPFWIVFNYQQAPGVHQAAIDWALMHRIEPPDCASDFDETGVVDGIDLGVLLGNWSIPPGSPGCEGAGPCPSDINDDGVVDGIDLGILLSDWGLCTA